VTEKHKTGKGISGKAVASLRKHAIANKFLVRIFGDQDSKLAKSTETEPYEQTNATS